MKAAIINILRKFSITGLLIKILNEKKLKKRKATYLIAKMYKNKSAFVVQIGSNDGKNGDPLHNLITSNKKIRALFVEPVPYLFERLKKNYNFESRFIFENSAINDGEPQTFYWVDDKAKNIIPDLPYWADQIGSFNKEHILKHLNGMLEPFIVSQVINGLSLTQLFQKHQIASIDILHIDTEGYDWNILKQLNLDLYTPEIILYEYVHLNGNAINESLQLLNKVYYIFKIKNDFLCIKKNNKIINQVKYKYLSEYKIN